MERRGGRPLRIGDRFLVSYRDDDVWHERLLVRALTEKNWLIATPDGDVYPEKITNCDGATGPSAMRRLVSGRGSGPARDLPPGCGRVHRFDTVPDEDALRVWVSRSRPEKDAWEHEAGRIAFEQGLVFLPRGGTIGFEEFMAGDIRHPARHMRDGDVPVSTTNHKGFQTCLGWRSTAGKGRNPAGAECPP